MSDVEKVDSKEGCRDEVDVIRAMNSRDDTKSSTLPRLNGHLHVAC